VLDVGGFRWSESKQTTKLESFIQVSHRPTSGGSSNALTERRNRREDDGAVRPIREAVLKIGRQLVATKRHAHGLDRAPYFISHPTTSRSTNPFCPPPAPSVVLV
jgi:hypothetical protein